jgi:formylglycine-generating enzyme required for sulfatase activity
MGSTPWTAVKLARVGEKYPAVGISWYDATAFCARLSLIEGLKYRLPTEAEWEYACRAGSQMNFGFGDNQAMLDQYAWFGGSETGYEYLQAVALRMPNRWGLFDMHGNAWEWCNDWYGEYEFASAVDPVGPAKGSSRVLRGGYLVNRPSSLRSAFRNFFPPDRASFNVGFRLAVSVPTDPE